MKTRIIETKFWKDSYVSDLSIEERLLFLYFLTNEKVNILHCYEITNREIEFDTGLEGGLIGASKTKFQGDKKIAFNGNYVCLLNAYKYENFTGELADKGKVRLLNQLPKDIQEWYKSIYPLEAPLKETINNKQETISNKQEIKNSKGYKKLITKVNSLRNK
jgi:hypothetical protein